MTTDFSIDMRSGRYLCGRFHWLPQSCKITQMIDRTKLSLLFIAVTFTFTVSSSLTSNKTSAQATVKTTNAETPTPTPSVTPVAEKINNNLFCGYFLGISPGHFCGNCPGSVDVVSCFFILLVLQY